MWTKYDAHIELSDDEMAIRAEAIAKRVVGSDASMKDWGVAWDSAYLALSDLKMPIEGDPD